MKKLKYIVLLSFLFFFSTACEEDFLERVPTDAVSELSVFTTTANARAALNGIHRLLYSRVNPPDSQDAGGQGSIMIALDLMGEDVVHDIFWWYTANYQWRSHRGVNFRYPDFAYRFYYRIILNANLIIENIDGAEGPESDKAEIKAQALTYRAWSHHVLVQLFAERYKESGGNTQLGVPIMIESSQEGLARSTVEEVYTQINADLTEAVTLFADAPARFAKSHFDVSVAKGLQARVALTQGRWADAAQLANEARQGYNLMSKDDYTAGFNSVDNSEWMWGSLMLDDQQIFFAHFFGFMSHNFSSSSIRGNPTSMNSMLFEKIPDTDIRKNNFSETGLTVDELPTAGSKTVPYHSRKFTAANSGLSVGDLPHMRASEMYLIEAEARAKAGQDAQAANVLFELNTVRDDAYVLSTNTGQALVDEILIYRRAELWGEGFRFLDLKRLNLPLNRNVDASNHKLSVALVEEVPAGDIRWQWVFPQDEMDANPNIIQNPL